jgi:hypothetical protein
MNKVNDLKQLVSINAHQLEAKINKFLPHYINEINEVDAPSFVERLWLFLKNETQSRNCRITGRPLQFINFTKGYRDYADGVTLDEIEDYWLTQDAKHLTQNDLDYIQAFIDKGISRNTHRNDIRLLELVYTNTKFLEKRCLFSERIFCILNNITEKPTKNFINYNLGYTSYTSEEIRQQQLECAAMIGSTDLKQGVKIYTFLNRNKIDNAKLYDLPITDVNKKFVICPVLNVRVIAIKKMYIKNILAMTVAEFKEKFPDQLLVSPVLSETITKAMNEIDEETGLTKHELSNINTAKKMREVDENGLNGYQRLGMKTRNTHMNNIDENGLNGYQRLAQYRNETITDNGKSIQQNSLVKNHITRSLNSNSFSKASKLSKVYLQPILDFLEIHKIKHYFDEDEYLINDNGDLYFYDLVIPSMNLCVEFDGKSFHPSIYLNESEWKQWTSLFSKASADTVYNNDLNKTKVLYNKRGYSTWRIYDWDTEDTKNQVNILYDFIKESYDRIE